MNIAILEQLLPITSEEQDILNGKNKINQNLYMSDSANMVSAKKLVSTGNPIAMRKHTRFVHFPSHRHDYIEMVYMCQGTTTHIINEKEIILNAGETLILNQHSYQEILPASQNDVALNFIILPEFLNKTLEVIDNSNSLLKSFIVDCIANRKNGEGYLHLKTSRILPIQNLFENLIYNFLFKKTEFEKINHITISLLFLQFISNFEKLTVESDKQSITVRLLKYIEENYQNANLSDFAKLSHYDFYWLSKEIKRKTGKTYTQLLQEKRLSQAALLLTNTNVKISDIALAVGYNNMSYFHKIFEARFKLSPKRYRINNSKAQTKKTKNINA